MKDQAKEELKEKQDIEKEEQSIQIARHQIQMARDQQDDHQRARQLMVNDRRKSKYVIRT